MIKLLSFALAFLSLSNFITYCYTARILGIFPSCGYSQFILGGKLMRELAARGHEVTVISPFPTKTPIKNYVDVPVNGAVALCEEVDIFGMESSMSINLLIGHEIGSSLSEQVFKEDHLKQFLNSNVTFDLVICELFLDYSLMAIAHHFKAPLVLFSSQGPNESSKELLHHPLPFVYVPFTLGDYDYEMTTFARLKNFFDYLLFDVFDKFVMIPHHDKILKKYLPNSPTISEIIPTIELVLYNSHVSSSLAVPLLPNMIEIGGFHIESKPLPKDLQKFLDEAVDGVIYFSMGSNLKSKDFSIGIRNAFFDAFADLKLKVLWKFEDETVETPKNVKIKKWLPQQDILAHPNVKLFITHSGLISAVETVYFGVPTLGIPIFADQKRNAALSKKREIGLTLDFGNITKDSLIENINELLYNPKYAKNAKFRSTIMRDQETKPLDRAMFWIEYVLRHKGARHLQVYGTTMPWCQYYAIDLIGIALLSVLALLLLCRFIKSKFKRSTNKKQRKDKKQ